MLLPRRQSRRRGWTAPFPPPTTTNQLPPSLCSQRPPPPSTPRFLSGLPRPIDDDFGLVKVTKKDEDVHRGVPVKTPPSTSTASVTPWSERGRRDSTKRYSLCHGRKRVDMVLKKHYHDHICPCSRDWNQLIRIRQPKRVQKCS